MSSACTTVLELYNHPATKNTSTDPLKPQCGADLGFAGDNYKLAAGQNQTIRQGPKRRTTTTGKNGVTFQSGLIFGSCIPSGGDADRVKTSKSKKQLVDSVDALLKPSTITSGQLSGSQENISSNSYASVVSRRKDSDLLNFCNFENELLADNFAKLALPASSSAPAMSTSGKIQGKTVSTAVSKRDVGIQVNFPSKPKVPIGMKNQWTMTNRRGLTKNKCVAAKICCNDEDKLTTHTHPPVQFLGNQFNFENAVANSVSQLGIKFLDVDDEVVPIYPKTCD